MTETRKQFFIFNWIKINIMFLKYLIRLHTLLQYLILITILTLTLISKTSIATITATKFSGTRLLVNINKCCQNGEYLDENQTCIAGAAEKWIPSIYMIGRKKFFSPRGEAPPFFRFIENAKSIFSKCEDVEFLTNDKKKYIIFSNGSLHLTEKWLSLNQSHYCVDENTALVCFPKKNDDSLTFTKKLSKIKKCCTRDLVYNREIKTCDTLKNYQSHPINRFNFVNTSIVEIIYGFPHCNKEASYVIAGIFKPEFFESATGSLNLDSGKILKSESFCIEHSVGDSKIDNGIIKELDIYNIEKINSKNEILLSEALSTDLKKLDEINENDVQIFTCSEQFSQPNVYKPFFENENEENPEEQHLKFHLLAGGLLISVIFLVATLTTGFLMPSNHHVLHWKCQSFYVGCLLFGDLLLAVNQIAGKSITGRYCIAIEIILLLLSCCSFSILNKTELPNKTICMHFFFLSAFFWLNTMCFNIWWTFRDFRPTSLEKNQEVLRLRIYSIYAWGMPSTIVGIAAILDLIPEGNNFLRPRFGENQCWFYGNIEIFAYFFGPIGVLLFINMLLFCSTARQLTCGLWKIDDVKSTSEKAALGRVCLKLVIVMGVTWIADIVSWVVGGHWYIWCITDLINALQGVFIFIVVGCQPQVWSAVKRFWTSKTGRGITTNINGPQHSSSSHGLPSIGETVTNNTLINSGSNTTTMKVPIETAC